MLHAVEVLWDALSSLLPGNWPYQPDCHASTGNADCNRPVALWLLAAVPLLVLLCILLGLGGGGAYHYFVCPRHADPDTDGFVYYTPSQRWLEGQKWVRLAEEERAAKYLRWEVREAAREQERRQVDTEERRAKYKHRTDALALLSGEGSTTQVERAWTDEQQERHRRIAFEALDGRSESPVRASAPRWWKQEHERVEQTEVPGTGPSNAPIPRIQIERASLS